VTKQYGRKASLIYYDVTNYYFETDIQDRERMKGYTKENRRDPIIQMGMALDEKGIPMAYRLFPGNTPDCETYIPALKSIKKEYGVKRAIVVEDKGLNDGDNIVFNVALGDGYIFSQSVRGGSKELSQLKILTWTTRRKV
jgi:transposase